MLRKIKEIILKYWCLDFNSIELKIFKQFSNLKTHDKRRYEFLKFIYKYKIYYKLTPKEASYLAL